MENKQYLDEAGLGEVGKVIKENYASKEDLSKVDVTEQLVDYAKKTDLDSKVNKVDGKSLSSNDYSNEDKAKVDAIPENPKYTDTTYDLSGYATKEDVPTKISQLTNDKTFKTEEEIKQLISDSQKLKKEIVDSLPTTGEVDVIYLLKNKNDSNNVYTEYLWINDNWEIIGDTKVDLTDYAKKTDLNDKVDKIDGKGLSTCDYTNENKSLLESYKHQQLLEKVQKTIGTVVASNIDLAYIENCIISGVYYLGTNKANFVDFDKVEIQDSSIVNLGTTSFDEKLKQNPASTRGEYIIEVEKTDATYHPAKDLTQPCIVLQTLRNITSGLEFFRTTKTAKLEYHDSSMVNSADKAGEIPTISEEDWGNWEISGNSEIFIESVNPNRRMAGLMTPEDKKKLDSINVEQLSKPSEIVNDLTTGGVDKALSAEQGKILNETKIDKTELSNYAKSTDIKTSLSELTDDSTHRTVTDEEKAKWNGMIQKNDILEMINQMIEKKVKPDSIKGLKMTAVIDQSNPDPLACITYEDDAKDMTKGSSEWDKFFGTKLVLFKDGNEVRDLQDSELNSLTPDDGDVMVKFKRMGLNIYTVDDKVYVTMTDDPNDNEFKYYAHTRGTERREAFYLGAYLGYEKDGKLRSVKGFEPTGNKTIGDFRATAQANGKGYEQLAFCQWTFLQAMYVLKYGNLDSQTALGKGLTGGDNFLNTGGTNGKGIDFGTPNGTDQMKFQYLEDVWGNKFQWCDGCGTASGKFWIGTDKFNNNRDGYQDYAVETLNWECVKKVFGDSERGFLGKEGGASETTYYSDYASVSLIGAAFSIVGGGWSDVGRAGLFFFSCNSGTPPASSNIGARLMFL